jgi:hypothetical protein
MLWVALLVIRAGLWPLSAFGIGPFPQLTDAVPPAVLACLSVFARTVLALCVSGRLLRVRTFPA